MAIETKKSNKRFKEIPTEQVESALLWMQDKAHIVEINEKMTKKGRQWGSSAYSKIASGLRQAFRDGKIVINSNASQHIE